MRNSCRRDGELDQKIDNGAPNTGDLRAMSTETGSTGWFGSVSEQDDICVSATTPALWDVRADAQSCNAVYLF